jgi:type IV pilus assembly protein PilB
MFKPFSLMQSKAEGATSEAQSGQKPNPLWPRLKQSPESKNQQGQGTKEGSQFLLSAEELGIQSSVTETTSQASGANVQGQPSHHNPYLQPQGMPDLSQAAFQPLVPSPPTYENHTASLTKAEVPQQVSQHVIPQPSKFTQALTEEWGMPTGSSPVQMAPQPSIASPYTATTTEHLQPLWTAQEVPTQMPQGPLQQASQTFIPIEATSLQSVPNSVPNPISEATSLETTYQAVNGAATDVAHAHSTPFQPEGFQSVQNSQEDASHVPAFHSPFEEAMTATNPVESPFGDVSMLSPFESTTAPSQDIQSPFEQTSLEYQAFDGGYHSVEASSAPSFSEQPSWDTSWQNTSENIATNQAQTPQEVTQGFAQEFESTQAWSHPEQTTAEPQTPSSWDVPLGQSQGFEDFTPVTHTDPHAFGDTLGNPTNLTNSEVAPMADWQTSPHDMPNMAIPHLAGSQEASQPQAYPEALADIPDELGDYRQGLSMIQSIQADTQQVTPSEMTLHWETSTIDEEDDFIPDPEDTFGTAKSSPKETLTNPSSLALHEGFMAVGQVDNAVEAVIDSDGDDFIPDPEKALASTSIDENLVSPPEPSPALTTATPSLPVVSSPMTSGGLSKASGGLMSSLFDDISSVATHQAEHEANRPKKVAKNLKRIGDILIDMEILNAKQLEQALAESKALGVPLGTTLISLGWATEQQLGQALALQHGLPYVHSKDIKLEQLRSFMGLLPEQLIRSKFIIPFKKENRRLGVILSHPNDLNLLDEIAQITGYRVSPYICAHSEIIRIIETFYASKQESTEEALARMEAEMNEKDGDTLGNPKAESIEDEIEHADSGAVHLTNAILLRAIEINASDIHIEQQKERMLIRVRVDGVLREMESFPKRMSDPILTRLKITSSMDIAERRRPQDGRLRIRYGGGEVDMRVNTLPCRYGEKVCLRILKANATTGGLEKLGLNTDEVERIEKMIRSPNGMVLVTGPTGSGKTTTLYSFLREIQSVEINITTVEDPVEYPLPGVNQTQISHKSGVNFALCLRAILRQDPDVVMVGEIRDHETLEVSLHAALTGHLVFSTLHTNSTVKTINRLLDMGAPCYQISTALNGILAQRLVRTICPHCREAYLPSEKELEIMKLKQNPDNPIYFYRGAGCNKCEDSGYKGRLGLYEILIMSRELQEMIDNSESVHKLQDMAIAQGMNTLSMDGRKKLLQGITTFAEVTRVLGIELDIPEHIPQPNIDQSTIELKK